MRVIVLGDEDTVNAFRLIGFEGYVVDSKSLVPRIKEFMSMDDVAAILVTSSVSGEAGQEFINLRTRIRKPLILEVPALGNSENKEVNYMAILRSVLGI
ncbi:V-type ATP synthase subunit F [Caldivirga sp. UBA161]|uniref:V-type ATP synthase subunit F n=1 Tax=Caldivirga sp. UBA161 TaxID=1915569 RepID=UPI0025C61770|nr:V-type ATP synthase subunit F [Caldivirga sp. UBA161]